MTQFIKIGEHYIQLDEIAKIAVTKNSSGSFQASFYNKRSQLFAAQTFNTEPAALEFAEKSIGFVDNKKSAIKSPSHA